MNRNHPYFLRGVASLLVVWSVGATAALDPEAVVAELEHPDYEVRQLATDRLLVDETLTPADFAALAEAAGSPESRHRLLGVARHHTLRRLRRQVFPADGPASLGVSQPTVQNVNRDPNAATQVVILRVLPGFPAHGRLRPYDRVVALDGQAFHESPGMLFSDHIRRYRAGQEVRLTVKRGGETLDVVTPLANSTALVAMYVQPRLDLAPAFQRAWDRARETDYAALLPASLARQNDSDPPARDPLAEP
ncbi:MAG: PDZ domain-containing protein [Planctomycetota bacterium]